MIDVYFNNVLLNDYFEIADIQRDILPPKSVNKISVAKMNGAKILSKKSDVRYVKIDVRGKADSLDLLQEKLDDVAEFLDVGEAVLEISDEGGRIRYATLEGDTITDQFINSVDASLNFLCAKTDKYEKVATTESIGAATITRVGNQKSYPVFYIKFNGSSSDFKITHVESDKSIESINEFLDLDELTIDTRTKTIFINGNDRTNTFNFEESTFFFLEKENTFEIVGTNIDTITMEYVGRWK